MPPKMVIVSLAMLLVQGYAQAIVTAMPPKVVLASWAMSLVQGYSQEEAVDELSCKQNVEGKCVDVESSSVLIQSRTLQARITQMSESPDPQDENTSQGGPHVSDVDGFGLLESCTDDDVALPGTEMRGPDETSEDDHAVLDDFSDEDTPMEDDFQEDTYSSDEFAEDHREAEEDDVSLEESASAANPAANLLDTAEKHEILRHPRPAKRDVTLDAALLDMDSMDTTSPSVAIIKENYWCDSHERLSSAKTVEECAEQAKQKNKKFFIYAPGDRHRHWCGVPRQETCAPSNLKPNTGLNYYRIKGANGEAFLEKLAD